jgi:hypothetical protein
VKSSAGGEGKAVRYMEDPVRELIRGVREGLGWERARAHDAKKAHNSSDAHAHECARVGKHGVAMVVSGNRAK